MLPNEQPAFCKTLLMVAEYYGKELSPAVIEVYWQGLRQYDLAAVEKALWAHANNPDTGQFMPKVADVAKMMQGRTSDQAAVAWSKVDTAVRQVGIYQDVVFDDPVIHRVVADMGGWAYLNGKTEQDWPFVARDFENRYRGFCMRGETPEYPRVLIGLANAHNQNAGFRSMPPILVGDQRKAVLVLQGGTTAPLLEIQPLAGAARQALALTAAAIDAEAHSANG